LLCGCLPFDDDTNAINDAHLVNTKFQLRYPRWAKNLSPSAKDLLSKLLTIDARVRYTADQTLDHPWVRGDAAPKTSLLASPKQMRSSPYRKQPTKANPTSPAQGRYVPPAGMRKTLSNH
jgi:serine/threonine protein kinase